MRFFLVLILILHLTISSSYGQLDSMERTYNPLTVKLTEDGGKYIRFILCGQMWLQSKNLSEPQESLIIRPQIRRARVLMFSQISPRFMIMSHFGINSEFSDGLHPLGESNDVNLFFHDFWAQYKIAGDHYAGIGLHYWNGLSRLSSQSILNLVTLDAPIFNWAQLGLSDQFARHLGVFAKGHQGRFNYRVSINDALLNTLETPVMPTANETLYGGRSRALEEGLDMNRLVIQGYFHWEFLDRENHSLPYFVGSYLGNKELLNVGAGFFYHKGGTYRENEPSNPEYFDVNHFAADIFYEKPLHKNSMLSLLLTYYNYNFGPDYVKRAANPGSLVATGDVVYGQAGFLLPSQQQFNRWMPYVSYAIGNADAHNSTSNLFKTGINFFMNGHHSKFTLEYQQSTTAIGSKAQFITFQSHIFL